MRFLREAMFDFGGYRTKGTVVRKNEASVVIRLRVRDRKTKKPKDIEITRHMVKHNVELL